MNTKRTVLKGIAVIAILAAGCSNNGGITGPQAPIEESSYVSNTTPTPTVAKDAAQAPRQWLELTGKIVRSEIEGGCWYFETEKERYEPRFDRFDATIFSGATLKVKGYVDDLVTSICMIGPVLQVVAYEVFYPAAKTMPSGGNLVTLTGTLGLTKDGCYFVATTKEHIALELPICPSPPLLGSLIVVTGTWSMLDYVPCGMERLLNVETITFIGPPPTPVYW
ncbi:MAG: hypothetical protein A2W25_06185 [candidate division Zixibacteria bacterium RBG_16_53_22]|nr:MAG: hypothetical protein A2W25_06185 [candidate division Zixibacteria bacterium RBG_16_53_22]